MNASTKQEVVTQINYNWRQVPVTPNYPSGEDFDSFNLGSEETYTYQPEKKTRKVLGIFEHVSQGTGDAWYYDIVFSDATIRRIFNPNQVFKKAYLGTPKTMEELFKEAFSSLQKEQDALSKAK